MRTLVKLAALSEGLRFDNYAERRLAARLASAVLENVPAPTAWRDAEWRVGGSVLPPLSPRPEGRVEAAVNRLLRHLKLVVQALRGPLETTSGWWADKLAVAAAEAMAARGAPEEAPAQGKVKALLDNKLLLIDELVPKSEAAPVRLGMPVRSAHRCASACCLHAMPCSLDIAAAS